MEAVGSAASILALAEAAGKIVLKCVEYAKAVKHAKDDILRLRDEVLGLETALRSTASIVRGPDGDRLKASEQLLRTIQNTDGILSEILCQLSPKSARHALGRIGVRSLKWPFQAQETKKRIQGVHSCTEALGLTLQVDHM